MTEPFLFMTNTGFVQKSFCNSFAVVEDELKSDFCEEQEKRDELSVVDIFFYDSPVY